MDKIALHHNYIYFNGIMPLLALVSIAFDFKALTIILLLILLGNNILTIFAMHVQK